MQKLILCDINVADRGKSTTLLKLLDLFEKDKANFELKDKKDDIGEEKDVFAVFEFKSNGRKVIIQTAGDSEDEYKHVRDYKPNAYIIVCASRTKGQAFDAVNDIAEKGKYGIIWFQNFFIDKKLRHPHRKISDEINLNLAGSIFNFVKKYLKDS